MLVAGEMVIIPRNLLIDLPASRPSRSARSSISPPPRARPSTRAASPLRTRARPPPASRASRPTARVAARSSPATPISRRGDRLAPGRRHLHQLRRRLVPRERHARRRHDRHDGAAQRPLGHADRAEGRRLRQRPELQRRPALHGRQPELHAQLRHGLPALHPEHGHVPRQPHGRRRRRAARATSCAPRAIPPPRQLGRRQRLALHGAADARRQRPRSLATSRPSAASRSSRRTRLKSASS